MQRSPTPETDTVLLRGGEGEVSRNRAMQRSPTPEMDTVLQRGGEGEVNGDRATPVEGFKKLWGLWADRELGFAWSVGTEGRSSGQRHYVDFFSCNYCMVGCS